MGGGGLGAWGVGVSVRYWGLLRGGWMGGGAGEGGIGGKAVGTPPRVKLSSSFPFDYVPCSMFKGLDRAHIIHPLILLAMYHDIIFLIPREIQYNQPPNRLYKGVQPLRKLSLWARIPLD